MKSNTGNKGEVTEFEALLNIWLKWKIIRMYDYWSEKVLVLYFLTIILSNMNFPTTGLSLIRTCIHQSFGVLM